MSESQVHEVETHAGTVTTTWACEVCKTPGIPRNRRQTTCGKQACKTEVKRRRRGGPQREQACSECGETLSPTKPRKVCSKPECQKAAQSKRAAAWYANNKDRVMESVNARRSAKAEEGRTAVVQIVAVSPTPIESAFQLAVADQVCAEQGVPVEDVAILRRDGAWFILAPYRIAKKLAGRKPAVRWDGSEVPVVLGVAWKLRVHVNAERECHVLRVGPQRVAEVSSHAVDQYIDRFRCGVSREVARQELEAAFRLGRRVGPSLTVPGAEIWRGPRQGSKAAPGRASRLRMVVGPHPAGGLAIVTVLPPRTRVDRTH